MENTANCLYEGYKYSQLNVKSRNLTEQKKEEEEGVEGGHEELRWYRTFFFLDSIEEEDSRGVNDIEVPRATNTRPRRKISHTPCQTTTRRDMASEEAALPSIVKDFPRSVHSRSTSPRAT